MPFRYLPTFLILCLSLLSVRTAAGNDQSVPPTPVPDNPTEQEFQFAERPQQETGKISEYNLKETLGDTGMKVAIGVGIVLIAVLLFSKKKAGKSIPVEAIEILGTIPTGARQNIQLIRFGQKLVMVESSVNGLKPISEITDPAEVNQMLDLIRPRTRQR